MIDHEDMLVATVSLAFSSTEEQKAWERYLDRMSAQARNPEPEDFGERDEA